MFKTCDSDPLSQLIGKQKSITTLATGGSEQFMKYAVIDVLQEAEMPFAALGQTSYPPSLRR